MYFKIFIHWSTDYQVLNEPITISNLHYKFLFRLYSPSEEFLKLENIEYPLKDTKKNKKNE